MKYTKHQTYSTEIKQQWKKKSNEDKQNPRRNMCKSLLCVLKHFGCDAARIRPEIERNKSVRKRWGEGEGEGRSEWARRMWDQEEWENKTESPTSNKRGKGVCLVWFWLLCWLNRLSFFLGFVFHQSASWIWATWSNKVRCKHTRTHTHNNAAKKRNVPTMCVDALTFLGGIDEYLLYTAILHYTTKAPNGEFWVHFITAMGEKKYQTTIIHHNKIFSMKIIYRAYCVSDQMISFVWNFRGFVYDQRISIIKSNSFTIKCDDSHRYRRKTLDFLQLFNHFFPSLLHKHNNHNE